MRWRFIFTAAFFTAALAAHGANAAGCSSPPGTAGDIIYNNTYNRVQYCDGTNWVNMGSAGSEVGIGTLTAGDFCTSDGNYINCTTGAISLTSQVTGTLQAAQFPALTGDVTTAAGSLVTSIGVGRVTNAMLAATGTSSASTFLRGDGTWANLSSITSTPGGANTQVQFNNSGAFGGDSNFDWDNTNKRLGIGTTTPADYINVAINTSNTTRSGITLGNAASGGAVGVTVNNNNGSGSVVLSTYGSTFPTTNGSYPGLGALSSKAGLLLASDGGVATGGADSITFATGGFNLNSTTRMVIEASGDVYINNLLEVGNANTSWIGIGEKPNGTASSTRISALSSTANASIVMNAKGTGSLSLNLEGGTGGIVFGNGAGSDNAQLSASGNLIVAGCSGCSSDSRLKRDIAPLEQALGLAALERLKPVSFRWRQDWGILMNARKQYGFIAQEAKDALPDMVFKSDPTSDTPDGTYNFNYQGLEASMVLAIQQLEAENDILRNELSALRGEIQAYRSAHP